MDSDDESGGVGAVERALQARRRRPQALAAPVTTPKQHDQPKAATVHGIRIRAAAGKRSISFSSSAQRAASASSDDMSISEDEASQRSQGRQRKRRRPAQHDDEDDEDDEEQEEDDAARAALLQEATFDEKRYFGAGLERAQFSRKCFNCGQTGHMQRDCPHGRVPQPCPRCGGTAHRVCPVLIGLREACDKAQARVRQARGGRRPALTTTLDAVSVVGIAAVCGLCGSPKHRTPQCEHAKHDFPLTTCLETGRLGFPRSSAATPTTGLRVPPTMAQQAQSDCSVEDAVQFGVDAAALPTAQEAVALMLQRFPPPATAAAPKQQRTSTSTGSKARAGSNHRHHHHHRQHDATPRLAASASHKRKRSKGGAKHE